jgi:molybdenum cofactor cytidylyltransferase
MSQIVGILLAAGSSRRFGSDKRLHPMADGTPMALVAARHLAAACSRTIVAIRPDDTLLAGLLAAEEIEVVMCATAWQGMGHSLGCAIAASAEADGWLVALADMPFIQPASYRRVIQFLDEGASMVRPAHDGQYGHPVGFAAKHRAALLALVGDQGGRAILDADPAALVVCPVNDPGVLKDIDQLSQIELT